MLDDIIEIAADLFGDVLAEVIKAKRRGKAEADKPKRSKHGRKKRPAEDPWEQTAPTPPWEE